MKKFLAVAGLALTLAAPAFAAQVSYILSGTFTGTLAGNPFATDVVFTGVGDTSTAVDGGNYTAVELSSLSAVAGGVTYTLVGDYNFFANINGISGFQLRTGSDFLDFGAPSLAAYNAVTAFSPTAVSLFYSAEFETNAGLALIDTGDNLTFSAVVPEPATWTLMIGGFGLVGAAMRRRAVVAG